MSLDSGAASAPSRSTAYVSNLPFSLTNTDLHQIFTKFGKLIKVTIMRDRTTRKSRGVAFLLYKTREEALACVAATHDVVMFDRTLQAHMAKDNGRAAEYVRRREYPDKSRCYECGETGHRSYACPENTLGAREPPKKKLKIKKNKESDKSNDTKGEEGDDYDNYYNEDDYRNDTSGHKRKLPDEDEESLSAAISYSQKLREIDSEASSNGTDIKKDDSECQVKKKTYKPSAYFSDEEDLE